MRFETQSKWQDFLDGFRNVLYILDCYDDGDEWGYREFWESLSIGWFQEYIYPYDDPYHLNISPERRLRLDERPPTFYVSEEAYDKLVELHIFHIKTHSHSFVLSVFPICSFI